MKSLSSGGITRRTACGSTTWRSACVAREPERQRRGGLAGMDRLDPGAEHLADVRRVAERRARCRRARSHSVGRHDEAPARARRSRPGRQQDQPGSRGRRRRRPRRSAAAGTAPARCRVAPARSPARARARSPRRSGTADVEPEPLTPARSTLNQSTRRRSSRIAVPAGAGSTSAAQAADHDDGRDAEIASTGGGARAGALAVLLGVAVGLRLDSATARATRSLYAARARSSPTASIACSSFANVPSALQLVERPSTHGDQLEPLVISRPQLSPPGALNWPTTIAVRDLARGQLERGREVDDDRVDPVRSCTPDDVVGVVEDLRRVRRLDLRGRRARGSSCRSARRCSRP